MRDLVRPPRCAAHWLWAACLWLVPASVFGANPEPQPLSLLKQTAEQVITVLNEKREVLARDPAQLYHLVETELLHHFDFQRMSRLALGRFWRSATPDQRQRFVQEFRDLLVRTYAGALLEYHNERILYGPVRGEPQAGDVTVHTEVERPGSVAVPIDYRMHRDDGEWRVYDVIVDGVSLITNYRSSFGAQIQRRGMAQLIEELSERNRKSQ